MKQQILYKSKEYAILVQLSVAGDEQAFDRLYRYWHPRWYRFCVCLVGDSQDAKDVMQDAAVHIATHVSRLRDPEQFAPWAYTIIRRRAADYVRSKLRQRTLSTALKAEAETSQQYAELEEIDSDITRAMAQLSDEQVNLVTLFYAYGLSVNELASVFDLPAGTIKSRLYGARQTLKTLLEKSQENEHD